MWKVVFRGIRETVERRVCRTNVYSQSSHDHGMDEVETCLTCQEHFVSPVRTECVRGFYGSAKGAGAKNNRHDSEWNNTKHNWSEAVNWTSVLAAGWVVCETFFMRRRVFDRDNSTEAVKGKLYDRPGVSYIILRVLNLHPHITSKILPVTNCVGTSKKNSNLQESKLQWTAEKSFGPVTLEEAFKEAVDEFSKTHKVVVGEYELRYGIKALEEERYKDALTHFSTGAKLLSPGSMFNLGLCYELGVGTLANQAKAAKYYNDAAAHDHADALYNLGVFHAQGKGGLPIDINTARNCFTRAAKLGQVQAQHALDLEKPKIQLKKNTSTVPKANLKSSDLKKNDESNIRLKLSDIMLYTNFDDTFGTVAKSREVFLDYLGLKKHNQPIMIATNDCPVPY